MFVKLINHSWCVALKGARVFKKEKVFPEYSDEEKQLFITLPPEVHGHAAPHQNRRSSGDILKFVSSLAFCT